LVYQALSSLGNEQYLKLSHAAEKIIHAKIPRITSLKEEFLWCSFTDARGVAWHFCIMCLVGQLGVRWGWRSAMGGRGRGGEGHKELN